MLENLVKIMRMSLVSGVMHKSGHNDVYARHLAVLRQVLHKSHAFLRVLFISSYKRYLRYSFSLQGHELRHGSHGRTAMDSTTSLQHLPLRKKTVLRHVQFV